MHKTQPITFEYCEILDYAVQVFHDALSSGKHLCYLKPDTRLPMMYIDDCLRALFEMMVAPEDQLSCRTYNVAAMSFTPDELFSAVKKRVPELEIEFKPDGRQNIGSYFYVIKHNYACTYS